jgi:hypothetical protein
MLLFQNVTKGPTHLAFVLFAALYAHSCFQYDDHILQDLIKRSTYSTNTVFMHAVKCVANIP